MATTDTTEARVRAALRELARAAPVHPDVVSAMGPAATGPAAIRRRPWLAPALAGAAVALVVALVVFFPVADRREVAEGTGDPSLPAHFPAYSVLQGHLAGPFGRAIALYTNGNGHEDWGFWQVLVAGADRDAYRRLEIPTGASWGRAGTRLSPDGTKVAVGALNTSVDGLRVIDLMTGQARHYERFPAPVDRHLSPLAMTPDGRRVAYIATDYTAGSGPLYLLDLETGTSSQVTGEDVSDVAISPDGTRIAYLTAQRVLRVAALNGAIERSLPALPERTRMGPHSWTPDGRHLVVLDDEAEEFQFLDVRGGSPAVPPIPAAQVMPRSWGSHILGWRSDTAMLLSTGDVDGTTDNLIVELDIAGRGHRILSQFAVGPRDDLAVTDVQLATGLLSTMDIREGGAADRGVWPRWAVLTTIACSAPLLLTLMLLWRRRARQRG